MAMLLVAVVKAYPRSSDWQPELVSQLVAEASQTRSAAQGLRVTGVW